MSKSIVMLIDAITPMPTSFWITSTLRTSRTFASSPTTIVFGITTGGRPFAPTTTGAATTSGTGTGAC